MAFWFEQPYKNLWRSIWCYSKISLDHNRIWWPYKLLLLPFLCIIVLKSVQRFMVKIRENEKEKHVDLTWFGKLPMSTQQEIGLSLCIKLRLHKWVFIPTLREEDFHYVFSPLHSTPLHSDVCPFFCIVFYSNMSHILQHTAYSIFNNKFQALLMITSRI